MRTKELVSTNPRILQVYKDNMAHANVEFTMPAVTSPIYETHHVTQNPQIQEIVNGNLRTIITPDMYSSFPAKLQALARVMSSPYECGRVLEADKPAIIDGKEHVVNFKGVGATTIARNGSVAYRAYLDMRHNLRLYPFYDGYGELADYDARYEIEGVDEFAKRGLDTEKILGIYAIDQLADVNGEYLPPSVLRGDGYFRGNPVILARASRSNFRLLDSVTMFERRQRLVIPQFREFVLDQFAQQEGVATPDLDSYLRFIATKVVGQELPLITEGYEMCSGGPSWQNLARNISVLGEELDLESVKNSFNLDYPYTWFDYPHHIATQVGNIDSTVRAMADTMSYDGPKADFQHLADTFWLGTKKAIEELNLDTLLGRIPDKVKDNFKITGENSLLRLIYKGIIKIYKESVLLGTYSMPIEESTRVYQARMVEHIRSEGQGLGVI